MGNSLEQHRDAIGFFNARSRTKREAPDCPFWANIKDLLVIVAFLQLLIAGILAKITKKCPDWSSPGPPLKSKSYLRDHTRFQNVCFFIKFINGL